VAALTDALPGLVPTFAENLPLRNVA